MMRICRAIHWMILLAGFYLLPFVISIEVLYPKCVTNSEGYNYNYGYHYEMSTYVCILQDTEVTDRTPLKFDSAYYRTFECRRCILHTIPKGIFVNPKLQNLLLGNSSIDRLNVKDFMGANALVYLNLSRNAITGIDAQVFAMAEKLETLDLSHNQIEHISQNAFVDTSLKVLCLQHNQIAVFRSILPTTLRALRLQNNLLSGNVSLSDAIDELDVSHNQIERLEIPPAETIAQITKLNIAHNNITSIKPLTGLIGLRTLDISFNAIADIRLDSFARMRNLSVLNLCASGLQRIEHGLFAGQTTRLNTLDISYNRLGRIEWTTLSVLDGLTQLYVDGNELHDLDGLRSSVTFSRRLTALGIADNPFTCAYLADFVTDFGAARLLVPETVAVHNVSNVHGMVCSDRTAAPTGPELGNTTAERSVLDAHVNRPPEHVLWNVPDELERMLHRFVSNLSAALPTPPATSVVIAQRPVTIEQTERAVVTTPTSSTRRQAAATATTPVANAMAANYGTILADMQRLLQQMHSNQLEYNREVAAKPTAASTTRPELVYTAQKRRDEEAALKLMQSAMDRQSSAQVALVWLLLLGVIMLLVVQMRGPLAAIWSQRVLRRRDRNGSQVANQGLVMDQSIV